MGKHIFDCRGVYTLYVNSYSLKYSFKNGVVYISVPNAGAEVKFNEHTDPSEVHLPEEFVNHLRRARWSEKAIEVLERKVLFTENFRWNGMQRINPRTGKLTDYVALN